MDFSIESDFIKKYIKKEYRERIIFELQSKKKREKGISRFSHSAPTVLNESFIPCPMTQLQDHLVALCSAQDECYMISGDTLDGHTLPLLDAVEYCQASHMAVILISSKFAVVKEEFEGGQPQVFISR